MSGSPVEARSFDARGTLLQVGSIPPEGRRAVPTQPGVDATIQARVCRGRDE